MSWVNLTWGITEDGKSKDYTRVKSDNRKHKTAYVSLSRAWFKYNLEVSKADVTDNK